MRQLIIDHIQRIRSESRDFSSQLTRWSGKYHGTAPPQAWSDVNYESMDDLDLLAFYNSLMRRYYAQM